MINSITYLHQLIPLHTLHVPHILTVLARSSAIAERPCNASCHWIYR